MTGRKEEIIKTKQRENREKLLNKTDEEISTLMDFSPQVTSRALCGCLATTAALRGRERKGGKVRPLSNLALALQCTTLAGSRET